jgi:hypothetical protein
MLLAEFNRLCLIALDRRPARSQPCELIDVISISSNVFANERKGIGELGISGPAAVSDAI